MLILTTVSLQDDNGNEVNFSMVADTIAITVMPRRGEEAEITVSRLEFVKVANVIAAASAK